MHYLVAKLRNGTYQADSRKSGGGKAPREEPGHQATRKSAPATGGSQEAPQVQAWNSGSP